MTKLIYWELQDPDESTCGVHSINAILQGPIVDYEELYRASLEIEELERQFLLEAGIIPDEYYKTENAHHRRTAFDFTALERVLGNHNYICERCKTNSLSHEQIDSSIAFLCNVSGHWLSMREVHDGRWFVIDSLKTGPIELDKANLYNHINEIILRNQSVFIVKNKDNKELPVYTHQEGKLRKHQRYTEI
ncbi:hypothetical protein BEWA_019370 [Theileria equi strain WA]|uniref:ubiquitinyl hydrolase 1 n=1 Tax=Theileria equi strain WA TaxID=1537102 RepID=L0ATW9_THEEQ|nr:hypothetical protein BEWA_019370 [Theileria equi strain WA]AFZ79092.1 hypothetical protein BEWA_019370 [Theileria equi strain WA]|eukprot:XP_004828758.1 hypothetical protein BEWA_019370 [Theileria equi strain WA]